MENVSQQILQEVLEAFDFGGHIVRAEPFGCGHINDTFRVYTSADRSYILQRMSAAAFKRPDQLMQNIIGVTEFLRKKAVQAGGDPDRESLTVLRPKNGRNYYTDSQGGAWRVTLYIAGSCCYQTADTPELFEASAKAFGRFQRMLCDYPADTLFETIPHFHDTEDRLDKLKAAIAAAPSELAGECRAEIDFALAREADCSVACRALREGVLPLRVTHNDTKLNNVLLDSETGQGLCVIDLDTTMPGLSIHDFGDSIRFGANHCAEDEQDLGKVNFDIELYEAYTRGFLEGAAGCLSQAELEYLPWGARLMTLECGIRFLTDYLQGNTYFRIHYPRQNLDRCRTQFKLVQDMEEQFAQMRHIVFKYAGL
ncbi:MAG: aminoglycoside phosphotransferase family protein [Oscillospiraceae bacterium]|nr:aminoglycoside phosphotransferase family protein [Oscillospiraceae bacterium]